MKKTKISQIRPTSPITELESPTERREWNAKRRALALTSGSCWVFFRDSDPDMQDPWAGHEIVIIEAAVKKGRMRLKAMAIHPQMLKRGTPAVRTVRYSELW